MLALSKQQGLSLLAAALSVITIAANVIETNHRLISAGASTPDINAVTSASAQMAATSSTDAVTTSNPWSYGCNGKPSACHVDQTIFVSGADGKPAAVLRLTFGRRPGDPRLLLMILLPPHILAERGVGFQIDDRPKNVFQVGECEPGACAVTMVVDKSAVQMLGSSRFIHVGFFDPQGRETVLSVKLDGLGGMLAKLGR